LKYSWIWLDPDLRETSFWKSFVNSMSLRTSTSGFHRRVCARRYEASMKIAFLVMLFAASAEGPAAATVPIPEPLSLREQIKADRAKAKADEESDSKARFWDRDANGKRPWDLPKKTPLTKE
jgi:hypothetical protein